MEEDVKIYGYLLNLIEIPVDVLMYWTLKAIDLQGVISEQDIHKYHDAICKAYDICKIDTKKTLAFHYPSADNYQDEVFEEVTLLGGKTGFRLKDALDDNAKELLEYRLVKLEAFIRKQSPDVKTMLEKASEIYQKEQPVSATLEEQVPNTKVLKVKHHLKKFFQ